MVRYKDFIKKVFLPSTLHKRVLQDLLVTLILLLNFRSGFTCRAVIGLCSPTLPSPRLYLCLETATTHTWFPYLYSTSPVRGLLKVISKIR